MKILLTGGAGYIGSVTARHLLSRGHHVKVFDNLSQGGSALLGMFAEDHFEFCQGDLRDDATLTAALSGCEAVVHLAAIVGDPACAKAPDLAKSVNLDASLRLFELALREQVSRFVFASTCSNYGRMADPDGYVDEQSDLRPVSLYAETKVAVEQVLLESSPKDTAVTCLRFATVFGLSQRMRFDLTVNEFTRDLLTKKRLTVYGEQFWRPYVHVHDIARAVAMTLEAHAATVNRQVFNVGSTTENYQKRRIVDIVREEVGDDLHIDYVATTEDPRDYRVSFAKIKSVLGYDISRDVRRGVREVITAVKAGLV
jgi:nucleoside-diphosphate-sugar epimerase